MKNECELQQNIPLWKGMKCNNLAPSKRDISPVAKEKLRSPPTYSYSDCTQTTLGGDGNIERGPASLELMLIFARVTVCIRESLRKDT